jgi:putative endonuclease
VGLALRLSSPHGEPPEFVEGRTTRAFGTDMEVTVYILRCSDGSYYTGLTKQEIEARVWEHNEGICDGYTKKRGPVELVFTQTYDRIIDAIARERQIKGWSE